MMQHSTLDPFDEKQYYNSIEHDVSINTGTWSRKDCRIFCCLSSCSRMREAHSIMTSGCSPRGASLESACNTLRPPRLKRRHAWISAVRGEELMRILSRAATICSNVALARSPSKWRRLIGIVSFSFLFLILSNEWHPGMFQIRRHLISGSFSQKTCIPDMVILVCRNWSRSWSVVLRVKAFTRTSKSGTYTWNRRYPKMVGPFCDL